MRTLRVKTVISVYSFSGTKTWNDFTKNALQTQTNKNIRIVTPQKDDE